MKAQSGKQAADISWHKVNLRQQNLEIKGLTAMAETEKAERIDKIGKTDKIDKEQKANQLDFCKFNRP